MSTQTIDDKRTAAKAACAVCGAKGRKKHTLDAASLDCPDCLAERQIHSKIGNKRGECNRCNAFAQRLIRHSGRRLQHEYADEYEALREETERDLYKAEIE